MKKLPSHEADTSTLDSDILAKLASSIVGEGPSAQATTRIKQRLMDRVAGQKQFFVFAAQGEWKTVGPGIQVKLLHKNDKTKSFLLHMDEKSALPLHEHDTDEESFVVEGEVWLDGVHCREGDYHFASAGTAHQSVRTERGCTLLIRTAAVIA